MKLSVAGKMTAITSLLLAVVFAVTTVINVRVQEKATIGIVRENSLELAETAASVLLESLDDHLAVPEFRLQNQVYSALPRERPHRPRARRRLPSKSPHASC